MSTGTSLGSWVQVQVTKRASRFPSTGPILGIYSGPGSRVWVQVPKYRSRFSQLAQYFFDIPLRRPKRFIFLGQGPVQGPREEVQGPCARATKRGARASGFSKTLNHACTSNCGPCSELRCLSLVALAHIRGPCTSFCGPCTYPSGPCTHFYLLD